MFVLHMALLPRILTVARAWTSGYVSKLLVPNTTPSRAPATLEQGPNAVRLKHGLSGAHLSLAIFAGVHASRASKYDSTRPPPHRLWGEAPRQVQRRDTEELGGERPKRLWRFRSGRAYKDAPSTCRLIPYPFFGYLVFGLGCYNHKVAYPKHGYVMSLQAPFKMRQIPQNRDH